MSSTKVEQILKRGECPFQPLRASKKEYKTFFTKGKYPTHWEDWQENLSRFRNITKLSRVLSRFGYSDFGTHQWRI